MSAPVQLWAARAAASPRAVLARQISAHPIHPKPVGGLWTADADTDGASAWTRWAAAELDEALPHRWLLQPEQAVRIAHIDCPSDWRALHPTGSCDWRAVAEQYDAVRVSLSAILTVPALRWSWSCPSSVWFRWCFTACERWSSAGAASAHRVRGRAGRQW